MTDYEKYQRFTDLLINTAQQLFVTRYHDRYIQSDGGAHTGAQRSFADAHVFCLIAQEHWDLATLEEELTNG